MAMSRAVHELQWMLQLLRDIGCSTASTRTVWCDNQAAIRISEPNGSSSSASKHFDVRHHHVREAVARGVIEVKWVASEDQLADVCTKALNKHTFTRLHHKNHARRSMQQEVSTCVQYVFKRCARDGVSQLHVESGKEEC